MARVSGNPQGPLIHATSYRYKSVVFFWDRSRPPVIRPEAGDVPYRVKDTDRIENIAFTELGSDRYDWIIKYRNGIVLVPNDLIPGSTIFIPTLVSLKERGIIP